MNSIIETKEKYSAEYFSNNLNSNGHQLEDNTIRAIYYFKLLPIEVFLIILGHLSTLTIRNFIICHPSLSHLRDKDLLIKLLSVRIPHRDISNHTLSQVAFICNYDYRPNRVAIASAGGAAIMFLKGGRVYLDVSNVNSDSEDEDNISPLTELDIVDAVDISSITSGFTVVGKGFVTHVILGQSIKSLSNVHIPDLDPIQVIYRKDKDKFPLILNKDGSVFVTGQYGPPKPIIDLPPIAYIERIEGSVAVVDINGKTWFILDDNRPVVSILDSRMTRREILMGHLKKYDEAELEKVQDVYGFLGSEGFLEMCDGDGNFILVLKDGSVSRIRITNSGDGYYFTQSVYEHFRFEY